MKLFFVRHAESVANAKLKNELGTGDQLSPKGIKQADRLVSVLKEYQFDHIFVSPSQRTIQTIAPYLRSVKRRAVVLPQAIEIKDVSIKAVIFKLLGKRDSEIKTKPIKLPTEYEDVVTFDPEFPTSIPKGEPHAEGVLRSHQLGRFFRKRFGDTDLSVLLVSHGTIGRYMLAHLAHLPIVPHPANAKLWLLQNRGERFQIGMMGA